MGLFVFASDRFARRCVAQLGECFVRMLACGKRNVGGCPRDGRHHAALALRQASLLHDHVAGPERLKVSMNIGASPNVVSECGCGRCQHVRRHAKSKCSQDHLGDALNLGSSASTQIGVDSAYVGPGSSNVGPNLGAGPTNDSGRLWRDFGQLCAISTTNSTNLEAGSDVTTHDIVACASMLPLARRGLTAVSPVRPGAPLRSRLFGEELRCQQLDPPGSFREAPAPGAPPRHPTRRANDANTSNVESSRANLRHTSNAMAMRRLITAPPPWGTPTGACTAESLSRKAPCIAGHTV